MWHIKLTKTVWVITVTVKYKLTPIIKRLASKFESKSSDFWTECFPSLQRSQRKGLRNIQPKTIRRFALSDIRYFLQFVGQSINVTYLNKISISGVLGL